MNITNIDSVPAFITKDGSAVTVEGTATLINTVSSEQLNTFDKSKITELPIFRRNYTNLLAINSGVTMAPEGVRIVNDPGQAVATVAPPMAEEVAAVAAPAAAAVTEPEVLTERKPKEGEEAAADDGKKPARPARAEKSDKDK